MEQPGPVRPVRFRFREGAGHPADARIGLLAQVVGEAFPEPVTTDSEGWVGLAHPKLTAVLVKALQEQQAEIEERDADVERLRQETTRLEAQSERLVHRLDRLEGIVRRLQQDVQPSGID